MKKKLIGLSILLLVLLLGLSTTSYALTETEFKNVCYNYLVNKQNYTSETAKNTVDSYNISSTMKQYFDNDNVGFFFLMTGQASDLIISVINKNGYTGSDSWKCLWYSNYRIWIPSSLTLYFASVRQNSGLYEESQEMQVQNEVINSFGTELDIYQAINSIVFPAGTWSSSLSKEGPFVDEYFVYSYNPDLIDLQVPDIDVQGELKTIKSMTYNEYVGQYVATVGMKKYLDYVDAEQYYYDNSISGWKLYRNNDNYIKNNDFESTNPIEVKCPSGWWVGNTLIKFTAWNTFGNNFGPQIFYVYLKDNSSVISNGVLQIGTFSGDYDNNMQNDINNQLADERTQEIINTITDDSQVNGILNDFGSGDINTFASKFGLPSIPNPFSQFIETIFYGITDVLTLDGDVTLDFGILGTINSSQFTTPTNAVTIFLSSFLTFIFVYYMIELGYSTLMSIREFNLDKSGIYHVEGMHPESGLQADGSWRLL